MSQSLATTSMSDYDLYLWKQSRHYRSYEKMGAHVVEQEGQRGVRFAVWAPNADYVSVIGDFNGWNRGTTPLSHQDAGIWDGFVPGVEPGARYKYYIHSKVNGYETERADPYGFHAEMRPQTASRVWDLSRYQWGDAAWLEKRRKTPLQQAPVAVYEVHLGGGMRDVYDNNRWMTYRELAPRMAEYVRDLGFTHVELMPITEYPFDGSWGYQTVGYFSPTSRYGDPDDFRYFVDTLHQAGIGVILDWVPAHFPTDGHALGFFDGTHLYEHDDPRRSMHPDWGTFIFNYGRYEVANFLISSALFWLDQYHIDGLRVDAVASMLYLDYGRKGGDWLPNQYGGRENIEAIDFLRRFNEAVSSNYPDVMTIAEESTSWPRVTGPVSEGGLGFTFKWNMGWMHDMLEYVEKDPIYRRYQHNNLTFGMLYQYSENFMLPFSHDEVVHLKKSMLSKMPGDDWQKFANLRLLLGYMMGYPGKKLLFMGAEFGQWSEFNENTGLEWNLLTWDRHREMQQWTRAVVSLYSTQPALHQWEQHSDGFEWVECNDRDTSTVSFLRFPEGRKEACLFICNFTPVPRLAHRVGLPWGGTWELVLDSDDHRFGGSGVGMRQTVQAEEHWSSGRPMSGVFEVPPLGVLIYRSVRPETPEQPATA